MIRVEHKHGVVWITLDRPECRNALSLQLLEKLKDALSPQSLADASAVVISGEGKTFSAGADLNELTGTSADVAMDDAIAEVISAIRDCAVPVIAAVNGPCVGAAVDISLACDIRVASEHAYFQIPATKLGLLYNPAAVVRMHAVLPREVLNRLLVRGERFNARQALSAGLVTHADTVSEVRTAAERAPPAASNVATAVAATEQLLDSLDQGDYEPDTWEQRRRQILDSPDRAAALQARKKEVKADMAIELKDLAGYSLGTRDLAYDERDSILYALSVGATTEQLDLVYENVLRALPCYAAALGLWAVEAAGELGAYDRKRSLHASQKIIMHSAMPSRGPIASKGRISGVWDKGKATLVDIEVSSDVFTASYGIFLPGVGGWGGDRGPSAPASAEDVEKSWSDSYTTSRDQATLYRLTGDRHPVHIDIDVAQANGFDRPILHGLCTLGVAARALAAAANAHPSDLRELEARLAAPVIPGDTVVTRAGVARDGSLQFETAVGETAVLKSGRAVFA